MRESQGAVSRFGWIIAFILALAACASGAEPDSRTADERRALGDGSPGAAEQSEPPRSEFEGSLALPRFPRGVEWLNLSRPIAVEDLRGRIVILDFWTYGCVNCIHMIPVLKELESAFPDELAVVGVHSAKFRGERGSDRIREVLRRYDIDHPVINDADFRVWRRFGAQAWPTFVIADPRGNVVGVQAGEIPEGLFARYIGEMVRYWDERHPGALTREPLPFSVRSSPRPSRGLRYPEGVAVDDAGGRLFVSDSANHRLVVIDLEKSEVATIIGSGTAALRDGSFGVASFNYPRGIAYHQETLYVADSGNHAVRAVHLEDRRVETVAGTGEQGRGAPPVGTRFPDPRSYPLSTPWDISLRSSQLIDIAMAGLHQIWTLDLADGTLGPSVGNGHEAALNGVPLAEAELAQPSGLHGVDGKLYFADAESSTVRSADFGEDQVTLISGTRKNDLFTFGDRDGEVGENLLQHPLGLAGEGEDLYVADTYNHTIRRVDLDTGVTETVAGSGEEPALRDGTDPRFNEPSALTVGDGVLYIADTNNHAIRILDTGSGEVSTLQIVNPGTLRREPREVLLIGDAESTDRETTLPIATVSAGPGTILLEYLLPAGYVINPLVESTYSVSVEGGGVTIPPERRRGTISEPSTRLPVLFDAVSADGDRLGERPEPDTTVRVGVTLYYCEKDDATVCLVDDVELLIPVAVTESATSQTVPIERQLPPPSVRTELFE